MTSDIELIDVFAAGADGVHTYRIPSLLVAPGGTLLAFCEARRESRADDAPKDIVLKRSHDGGRSWSRKQIVVPGPGAQGVNNPCPLVDGHSIFLFCINREKKGPCRHQHLITRSDDDGATWSAPVDIGERFDNYDDTFVPGPGVCVRMRSGRWIIPGNAGKHGYSEEHYAAGPGAAPFSRVAYSDDQGRTWHLGRPVDCPWSNESQAVELSHGSLMLNFRVQNRPPEGCRGVAVSSDGGETWRETYMARHLRDPGCQAGFIRCRPAESDETGDCLLFTNLDSPPSAEGGRARRNLTVRLSCDGGRTWPIARPIHPGPAAYSCPAVLPDDTIGVLYECGESQRYEKIRLARFSLDWLTRCEGT